MELAVISLKQIITMFIIMFVGVFCYKKNIVNEENNKSITAIVLNIVNPSVIFMSYQVEFKVELLNGLLISLLISVLSFAVMIVVSNVLMRKKNNPDYNIERIAMVYSNCGFIGIPIIRALVGDMGVFYLAAYITVFNVCLWTHGVFLMTTEHDIISTVKSVFSPCIIAVMIGLVFFGLNIRIPAVATNAIGAFADMNTPLAMLVAGVTVAQTNMIGAFKNIKMVKMSFIKLLLFPVLTILICIPFAKYGVSKEILLTMIVAAACPTGASGTMFAIRYGGNRLYASEIFGVTTLISVISIPAVVILAESVLGFFMM